MSTQTYTVAQALQTTASGITVVDSPANIAAAVGNTGMVSRVTQFTMLGSDVVSATQAEALSTLGGKFSTGAYTLTLRDSVAALTSSANAQGLAVASSVQVLDTIINVLTAANNPVIRAANTLTVTDNSTLTVAQLRMLESWPHFTCPGTIVVMADNAANLLSLTPAEMLPQMSWFAVSINSTVSAADAVRLAALPNFFLSAGITLKVADTLTNVNSFVTAHASIAATPGVALCVADSVANLTSGTAILTSLIQSYPGLSVTLGSDQSVATSQLAGLLAVPHFSAAAKGHTLTVVDTLANLLGLPAAQAALAQAAHLASNATASVTQVQQLALLPGFSAGAGKQLLVTDTIAHLANMSAAQAALATGITASDTLSALVIGWASSLPALASVTAATAQLDNGSYTLTQLAPLASLAGQGKLTVVPSGNATSLHVVDTLQDLASGSAELAALQQAASVVTTATDDHSIMSAGAAASLATIPGFDPGAHTLAVADTGAAISAVAESIFQDGFQSITVTSGTFAGPIADLLDPTLHMAAGSAAQLNTNATVDAATLLELTALPGFSVAASATLIVRDTAANLASHEAAVAGYASRVQVTDTAVVTAAVANELAILRDAIADAQFSFGPNMLVVSDSAVHLIDPANAAGITLASVLGLSGDSRVSASEAGQLAALGAKFVPGDAAVIIDDTGNALANLASDAAILAILNDWGSMVLLSADTTLSVADANLLAGFTGFLPSAHHLTLSDTAQHLLGAALPVLAMASAVALSQPDTLTVAGANALIGMHAPYISTNPLTIADTPAQLAAMSAALGTIAAGEALVASTQANAAEFAINAAQLAQLLALPHLDASGFAGQITVADTPNVLLADAATLGNLPAGLIGHVVPSLSADAVVSVSQAEALCALSGFALGDHDLTISDTGLNIARLDPVTHAMATDVQVTGGGTGIYSASDFLSLTQTSNFAGMAAVPVGDSAAALQGLVSLSADVLSHISSITVTAGDPITAAQAEALSTLPNVVPGFSVSVVDSLGNLLQGTGAQPDNWAGELLASHITLSEDATLNAAQALQLAPLGYRFDNGGHSLTLQDTPDALLAGVSGIGPIAGQIGETMLADSPTPWVVSIAQAEQLAMLPNFKIGPSDGIVADNPANLLAPINAALLAQVPSITLNGDATVSVQAAQGLQALAHFSLGTHDGGVANHLTISDGAGHLAKLDAATAALAMAVELQGNSIVSVADFDAIRGLPNYSDNGKLLLISDSAANLLTLVGSDMHLASAIMLAPDPSDSTLSATEAQLVATLPGFTPGIAQIGVLDTAADLLTVSGAGPLPDDWTGELAAGSVTLSQDGTVSASQAAELALLGSRFHLGTHALTVSDSAAQLTASASASGLALASQIQLAGDEILSAATATRLAALAGLDKAGHSVTVMDSAADLAFVGYAAGIALADTVQLNAATSLTVGAAEALIGMANFVANPSAPLTISDSLSGLLGLASANLANNNALLRATPIALSSDTVATVAQMAALAALQEFAQLSLDGHALTVADSGRHLASFMPVGAAVPTAYVMTGDASLTAAQAERLASLGINLDDNILTVADTPAALLDNANANGVALADALVLSGNASIDASTAETLEGISNFSTGGHLLTVSDTAQALLGMDAAAQQMVGVLALAASQAVDVTTLAGLTRLGIKFSAAGHTLSVSDTAGKLATLNSLETALTNAQVLSTDAVVSGVVAAELAALQNFALGNGVSLTVQDSVANLIVLPSAVQAIATLEQLVPGANVTVSAANAAALAALPHFSNAGAAITVDDSIASLTDAANSRWLTVDTGYVVTDSISNLMANVGSPLLSNASGVQLLGDTQTNVATLATLAAIPGFQAGSARLTIVDGPAEIAEHAAQISEFTTVARVNVSIPVSAADAETLAGLNDSGILSFAAGVHLAVQDSYAVLADPANAGGLALASAITVVDDIGQLLAAMQADWSGRAPSYNLDANGMVTGAQAAILNAAGSHFSLNGHTLAVQDDASAIATNAAALAALGLGVAVTDTVAHVAENASTLVALGSALLSVNLSDSVVISAAQAAALSGLAGKLAGNLVNVSDLAGAVDTTIPALQVLGVHLGSVQVTDTAAQVAAVSPDLAQLGASLTLHLTDSSPLDSGVAVNLLPVLGQLVAGTHIDVSDTAALLAVRASTLHQLDSIIGTLTISTGNTVDAATAAALAPLDSHLGVGVQLLVQDTAANVANSALELAQLRTDGHFAGVIVANAHAADIATCGSDLASLGAQVTISDDAAAVSANLDALQAFLTSGGSIGSISLTDSGSPSIMVTLGQITADAGVLAAAPYQLAVQDDASILAGDLANSQSVLLASLGHLATIAGSGTLALTADLLLSPQIDDGAGSVLSKYSGSVAVTDTALGQLDSLAAHGLALASVSVSTSAAAIESDLGSGNSRLLANLGLVDTIAADGNAITLTESEARAGFVNDGPGSVFDKLHGTASLAVTQVLTADASLVASLPVQPISIAVQDSAADIQADLGSPGSALAAKHALISGIVATDGGTQTYTLDIVGLDRDAVVLGKIDTPFQLAILDSTENLQAELQGGATTLLPHMTQISGISAAGPGTISLTEAQVTAPGIEDGVTPVLARLTGETLVVTDVAAADVGSILSLPFAPATITVSDTADNIAANLAMLAADRTSITAITITGGGTLHLTGAELLDVGVDNGAGSVLSMTANLILDATNVAATDVESVASLPVAPASIEVNDSAAGIQADLGSVASGILAHLDKISAITVNDGGTITLDASYALASNVDDGAGAAFSKITGGSLAVVGVGTGQIDTVATLYVPPASIAVSGSLAEVQSDLTGTSAILQHLGLISAITVTDGGSISLTEAQARTAFIDDGPSSAFAKLTGATLTVTDVLAADLDTVAHLPLPPAHIVVNDTPAGIAADLELGGNSQLLGNQALVDSIALSQAGYVMLSAGEILDPGLSGILAKLPPGSVVAGPVLVTDIDNVLASGGGQIDSIAVVDDAGVIVTDLASGSNILSNLSSITSITAISGSISMTTAQANAAGVDNGPGSALAKLKETTLTVTDAAITDIATLIALTHAPDHIAIVDTADHIGTDLASGALDLQPILGRIDSITVSDPINAIQLTGADALASGVPAVLAKVTGDLSVSAVDLASLPQIAALTGPQLHIAVSDSATNIEIELTSTPSLLVQYGELLADLHATSGGIISLTAQQVLQQGVDDGSTAALAHLSSDLVVTDAQASDLVPLASLTTLPVEIDINDDAASIQSDLTSGSSHLLTPPVALGSIVVNDGGTITLTDADATAAASVLSLVSGASLDITAVPVGDIAVMTGLTGLPTMLAVLDSAANVQFASGLGQMIATHTGSIASVAVNDGTVDTSTADAVYSDLQAIGVAFDEGNLTISDSAAALLNTEASTPAVMAAAHAVTLASNALDLTVADATALLGVLHGQLNGYQLTLCDSANHLLDPANAAVLAQANAVALDSSTAISAHSAEQLAGLGNFNAAAMPVTIADTPVNLVDPANADGIGLATTVSPASDCTVSAGMLAQLAGISAFTDGGHQITLQDTAANVLGTNPALLTMASDIDVADAAAQVVANLALLKSGLVDQGYALTISVSGAIENTPAISIDAATYAADQAVIDTIDTAGIVRVTGSAADLAALATTLHDDAAVGEVDVSDTPTNILLNLPVLETIGSKFVAATVSGAVVNAAEVAGLLSIPNLTAGSLIVSDSGAQIAAAIAANGQAGLDFLNNQTVQLVQDSVVSAADALALEGLTTLDKAGHSLSVWDSATHLTDSIDGYLAAISNGIVDHVYLRTAGGTTTITASTAGTLFSIPNFSKSNPDATANVLTVQDTAAHIGSAFAALRDNAARVDHVVVSGSATVTDALFGELLTLGATKAASVAITVRDTAGAIIAGAPSQTAGTPSITPAAWMLSGSATVDEAGLALLGGLTGFSAGAYTLTLSQDATIGVADANNIGSLGSAFRLGIHHLYLPGSIADMASLSGAAQAIVVPQITDSFSNIAGLLPSSGLLGGTITVTDSEAVSVSQAAAFLDLLKVGNNPGIPAANISFAGHSETVTDTLANIQILTGAPAWAQNTSVHSDFSLLVADNVANLIDPANLSALSAMAGTTLAGNQTTGAADAEALFAVKNAIHFNLDGQVLTVQDTAMNLLDPANMDGVGMASVLLLSGSESVSAADAGALLSTATFQINDPGTTLTISDSSDALLDGALLTTIGDCTYAAQLQVELAGPEVLDAQTAARLVSLPHFADTGDLSIQDSASYLLNPNNHAAEQAATSVTLAGDETVSAATAVHLAAVPNFDLGGFTLHLASDDYADAATLKTIADFGPGFDPNGHTLIMTQDAIALTPDEYAAAQADGLSANGHALSAIPVSLSVTAAGGSLILDGTGVDGATVTLYDANGGVLTTAAAAPTFEVTAADPGQGIHMVLTETNGGNVATGESAPVVLLEQSLLEGLVSSDSAVFASTGGANAVQVGTNEYLTLYDVAAAPANPANPVLVYDAGLHDLLLEVDQHSPVVLVTLGGATTPAHLDISEIIVKHQLG